MWLPDTISDNRVGLAALVVGGEADEPLREGVTAVKALDRKAILP